MTSENTWVIRINLSPKSWDMNNLIEKKFKKITKFIFKNEQLWGI